MINLLKGKTRLWKAFWLLPILLILSFVSIAFLLQASQQEELVKAVFPYLLGAMLIAMVFVWVAVWRCSRNTDWIGWCYLARYAVCQSIFETCLEGYVLVPGANIRIVEMGYSISRTLFYLVVAAGVIFFLVIRFSKSKKEGSSLAAVNENVERAKSLYLSGHYKQALFYFEQAQKEGELDPNAASFLRICQKRVKKT